MKAALLSLALMFAALAPAHAEDGGITVEQAWARATPPAARTGAAYMTLVNHGKTADRLVGVSSPVAAQAEVHTTETENGVMKMRPVESLDLPPGKPVTLAPGGMHVMFVGMKQQLKPGESFPLTLRFAKAPQQQVTVPVEKLGAMAPGGHGGMTMPMPGMQPGMQHGMGR